MLQGLAPAAALALCAPLAAAAQEGSSPRPPNVVFVMADDLGYGDLGCYGQRLIPTPNLDRLAAGGTRFTACYAGSTVCAPSRCALMTGLHTGHCTVRGNKRVPLPPGDVTVAEVLKRAGYATGAVGKWGLGGPGTTGIPNRQGFDSWFGFLDQRRAHNYYPEHLWRDEEKVRLPNRAEGGVATVKEVYAHDLFTRRALRFVERQRKGPFFLYLAYTVPHANNEAGRARGDGMEVPDYGPFADRDWPEPEKGRAAMIWRLDRDVGALMAKLNELRIARETVVFFTSDNGPHSEGGSKHEFFDSNGPLRGHKRSLHDGGIRVPMIVRWPGRIPAARECDFPWAFWDVLPTLADLAGVEPPDGIDGVSVLPTLLGEEQDAERFLYWEFHERGFHQAARRGAWKAVRKRRADAPLELYHLGRDPGEEHDVAAEHPEVVARFRDYLETARTESEHFPVRGPGPR